MPVNTPHRDYVNKLARWTKNRDAYEGEDAIKAKGQTYLIKPAGFRDDDYTRYVANAKWYGATARTVKGLTGSIFQKDPVLSTGSQVEKHLKDITLTGISIELLAEEVVSDVQLMGRYGVLLDWDDDMRRPYWSGYPCESILNWRVSRIGGASQLSLLVVSEDIHVPIDQFESEVSTRYRVCFLDDAGVYQVQVYETIESGGQDESFSLVNEYTPTRRGRSLDFIPFQFFNSNSLTSDVSRGPLDDLVNTNYAYYRHSADYEHGLFVTALPTAVVTGHSTDDDMRIGSLAAWVMPEPDAKAYYLEFSGSGLSTHEQAMQNDKQEMATLGARLLEERPDVNETLGAVQLRHSGELGSLKSMALLISEGLSNLLRLHHWWNGNTEDMEDDQFSMILNTDFDVAKLSAQELQGLMAAWQGGAISSETLFWNLQQGELIPDDRTFEDEQALIEQQAPARIPFGDMPTSSADNPDNNPQDDTNVDDGSAT